MLDKHQLGLRQTIATAEQYGKRKTILIPHAKKERTAAYVIHFRLNSHPSLHQN